MKKAEFPTAIIIIAIVILLVLSKIYFSEKKANLYVNDQAFFFTKESAVEKILCKKNMHIVMDPIYFLDAHKEEYFIANNISDENPLNLLRWIEEISHAHQEESKKFNLYIFNYYKKNYDQLSKQCSFSKIDYLLIKRKQIKNHCQLSLSSFSAKVIFKMGSPKIKDIVKNLQKEISKQDSIHIYKVDINRSCRLRKENYDEIVSLLKNENLDVGE